MKRNKLNHIGKATPSRGETSFRERAKKDSPHRPRTPEVEAIDDMSWRGNTTPGEWYAWLKFPPDKKAREKNQPGRTDSIACMILGEIVYWYRGTEVIKDGVEVPGLRSRKFRGDMLQKSYGDLVEKFGLSKKQTVQAVLRLEKAGLIARVLRSVKLKSRCLHNVLFIQIFPDRLREITFSVPENHREPSLPQGRQGDPSPKGDTVPPLRETPSLPQGGDIYKDYGTESTNKEKNPLSFASKGDQTFPESSAPEELPVESIEITLPQSYPPVEAKTEHPVEATPRLPDPHTAFPVRPGTHHIDWVAGLLQFDAAAAQAFQNVFADFTWAKRMARSFYNHRYNGTITEADLALLPFYHEAAFEDAPKPQSSADLLASIKNVLPVLKTTLRTQKLLPAIDDLQDAVEGNEGFTRSSFSTAVLYLKDVEESSAFEAVVDSVSEGVTQWGVRTALATKNIYPKFTDAHLEAIRQELRGDRLIPKFLQAMGIKAFKVLGIAEEEIRTILEARIAVAQARVDELKSVL